MQIRLRQLRDDAHAGEFGISQIDAQENWDANRLENELTAIGFFGGQRLVIVKNLLSAKDVDVDRVVQLLSDIVRGGTTRTNKVNSSQLVASNNNQEGVMSDTAEVTVIIVESNKPDKRTKLFKWLQKNAKAEELAKLFGNNWQKFAASLINERQIKLETPARQALMAETEGESWQLVNIIDQLLLWGQPLSLRGTPKQSQIQKGIPPLLQRDVGVSRDDSEEGPSRLIGVADVELFLRRKPRGDSFRLLESIATGRRAEVTRHIGDLWQQGEAPLRVLGAIVYQYRQLIRIKALSEEGTDSYQIVRELGIPPFVVGKIMPLAKKLAWHGLKEIYGQIAQIDDAIKSGKIEPEAGIELLVYNLLKLHSNQSKLIRVK